MKKAKLDQYKKQLQVRNKNLSETFARNSSQSRAEKEEGTEDYIDYAVNSYEKEFLLSLTDLERQELLLIKDALERIEDGEYGVCQQCSAEIPTKRLDVAPWARYCVTCQDLEERGILPKYAYERIGRFEDSLDSADKDVEEGAVAPSGGHKASEEEE